MTPMDGPRSSLHFDRDTNGNAVFYLWPAGDTGYVVTRPDSVGALWVLVRRYYRVLTVALLGSTALMRWQSDFFWVAPLPVLLVVGWYRAKARRILAGMPHRVIRRPATQQYRSVVGETRPGMLRLGIVFFAVVTVLLGTLLFTEPTFEKRLSAMKGVGASALFTLMFYWMLRSKRS